MKWKNIVSNHEKLMQLSFLLWFGSLLGNSDKSYNWSRSSKTKVPTVYKQSEF